MDSIEDLDRRLRDARERVRRFDQLAGQRETAGAQVRDVTDLIGRLERELAKEQKDVTKLEGGFAGFIAGLTGSKEERLARERGEAAAAHERLNGQRARLDGLRADLGGIEREMAQLSSAPGDYERALADKERLLVESGDTRGRRLVELGQQLADTQSDLKEYGEARQAGHGAGQALGQVLAHLGNATGASTWDMLGGGGLADAVEHGHLNQADQAAWHAQRALDVFSRELADIGWQANPQLPKVDTRWFADMFFDNIITDAIKHQRITKTRDAVAQTAHWVSDAVRTLSEQHDRLARRLDDLTREREQLLA